LPHTFETWEQVRRGFADAKINETSVFPVFEVTNAKSEFSDFSKIFKQITTENAVTAPACPQFISIVLV
jgi:hypothetical protein